MRRAGLALLAFALANALVQSLNPPRGDDLVYLRWAAERAWDPWTPMFRPPPFAGWRPMNAATWWLTVSVEGVGAALPQLAIVGLWATALGSLFVWVRARSSTSAALVAVTLMLATDRFRDLVGWRSWLTTTGELAFMGLALVAMERKRGDWALLLGVLAAWFKEPAGILLPAVALLVYRRPRLAIGILLGAAPSLLKAATDAGGPSPSLDSSGAYAMALVGMVWPIPALWNWLCSADTSRKSWAAILGLGALLPLLYHTFNATYLCEALFLLAALAAPALASRKGLLAALLLLGSWSLVPSATNARWQLLQLKERVATWHEIVRAEPTGWSLAPEAVESAQWWALRLEFDLKIKQAPGGTELRDGLLLTSSPTAP